PGREYVGARIGDAVRAPEKDPSARGVPRDANLPVVAEAAVRSARTKALVRHARALDAMLHNANADGQGSPDQMRELKEARSAFEKVRPHGWRDAEAAYVKNPELVREAGAGRVNRIVLALQLETEIRTGVDIDQGRRADRFVERWQKLDRSGQEQYQAGDMSGYKSTRAAMSDMAKSLERDPQLESLLANRKRELGINVDSGRRLGAELAFSHGIGRGRGIGI
ncbi:Ti-type conjugative transfer relaxase TraA, partial [Mesorhizobium opportunistum]